MTDERLKFLLEFIHACGAMHPEATPEEVQDLTPYYDTTLNLNSLGELEIGYPETDDDGEIRPNT